VNGGSQHPDKRRAGGHGPTLADEVEHLLPTPTASNPNDGEALESWEARRQRNLAKGINGNGQGTPLGVAVRLLPTPRVSAERTSQGTVVRSSTSPSLAQAVEIAAGQTPRELEGIEKIPPSWRGESTSPPSAAGKPSSDVQHPGQLSLGELASD
jgi:hypothetical protein